MEADPPTLTAMDGGDDDGTERTMMRTGQEGAAKQSKPHANFTFDAANVCVAAPPGG